MHALPRVTGGAQETLNLLYVVEKATAHFDRHNVWGRRPTTKSIDSTESGSGPHMKQSLMHGSNFQNPIQDAGL